MLTLKNDYLTVKINPLGAEVSSVRDNESGLEYMWQADAAYWGRHAPILFPIVGRLNQDHYTFQDHSYHLTQHGFARDRPFTVQDQTATRVVLQQTSDDRTRDVYPFDFTLTLTFELKDHELRTDLAVTNPAEDTLYFSIGAHPGFNVPLGGALADFTDYQVTVSPKKTYQRIPLVGSSSDSQHPVPLDLTQPLTLDHELFNHDAQILTLDNHETTVMLSTAADDHGVALTVAAPYLGIWSPYPKQAPFVCLEPWWGLADDVQASGQFTDKVGLQSFAGGQAFTAHYQVTYF